MAFRTTRFTNLKVISKKTNIGKDYSSDDIQVLGTMSGIRKKVSLYLGDSGSDAVFAMFKEVIDNAKDEFLADRNSYIGVDVSGDEYFVWDKGGGIPIEEKTIEETKQKMSTLVAVFTQLHAGGKFGSKAYEKGSAGTHGVGVTVTNGLSLKLDVWTFRNKKWYHVGFKKGKVVTELNKTTPLPKALAKQEKGTIIRFTPDYSCFDEGSSLSLKKLKSYCKLLSYVHGGLKIYLKTPKNEYTFYEKDGLKALLNEEVAALSEKEITTFGKYFIHSENGVDVALAWSTSSDEMINSYVSGSLTVEGGTHLAGLYEAISDALKPYKGKKEFSASDARAGIVGTINVTVIEPKFTSQAKVKLSKPETKKQVYDVLKPQFDEFFKSNKTMVKAIIARAEEMNKAFAKFQANKNSIAQFKKLSKKSLASKLSNCHSKNFEENELFLVEGDSAGGTAVEARDKNNQAILALRGKILNVFKAPPHKILENNEVQNILQAIGYDADNPESFKYKFGKVILLMDPDVDGKHISNLVLSVFQKILPDSFTKKRVYAVVAPLFNCQASNGRKIYGGSVEDVKAKLKELGLKEPKEGIQRIKGWGEVKEDTLEEIAFNKKTRKLARITKLTDGQLPDFIKLVGEDPEGTRRAILEM